VDFVDLFCGAGLASEAAKFIGLNPIAAVDYCPIALASYAKNHPQTRRLGVDLFKDIEDTLHCLHIYKSYNGVIWLSPPCQDFSTAKGSCYEVNNTEAIFELIAKVVYARPNAWIIIENVSPIIHAQYANAWYKVQDAVVQSGRQNVSRTWARNYVFNAWEYGVPQIRTRLILPIPPKGKSLIGLPTPSNKTKTLQECIGKGFKDVDIEHPVLCKAEYEIFKGMPAGGNWHDTEFGRKAALKYMKINKVSKVSDNFARRCSWDDIPPCVLASHRVRLKYGNFVHPEKDRRFTLGEMRQFQTIPKGYIIEGGLKERLRQIGNAVPVQMVARIIKYFLNSC